jgi:hypothetical protein
MSEFAVLEWDATAHLGTWPRVIAENMDEEAAWKIAHMNVHRFHRHVITMEELEDMRKVERDHDSETERSKLAGRA